LCSPGSPAVRRRTARPSSKTPPVTDKGCLLCRHPFLCTSR
jgi:hypothetical protein